MSLSKVSRVEIIDYRTCQTCNGERWIHEKGKKPYECKTCHGLGSPGRQVIKSHEDHNTRVEVMLQDGNQTLKVFLSEVTNE